MRLRSSGLTGLLKNYQALTIGSVFGNQRVVQNLSCESVAVSPAADLSPAISPLVVDPGYSRDHNQGVCSVANGTPSFLLPAFSLLASLDDVPCRHRSPR